MTLTGYKILESENESNNETIDSVMNVRREIQRNLLWCGSRPSWVISDLQRDDFASRTLSKRVIAGLLNGFLYFKLNAIRLGTRSGLRCINGCPA